MLRGNGSQRWGVLVADFYIKSVDSICAHWVQNRKIILSINMPTVSSCETTHHTCMGNCSCILEFPSNKWECTGDECKDTFVSCTAAFNSCVANAMEEKRAEDQASCAEGASLMPFLWLACSAAMAAKDGGF